MLDNLELGLEPVRSFEVDHAYFAKFRMQRLTVVLANLEVADKVRVAFLPSIPLFASVGGAGGGFLGFLSPANGASA